MDPGTIVGIGGFPNDAMLAYVLGLTRGPRLLWVGTAQREDAAGTRYWYERQRGRAEVSHLEFSLAPGRPAVGGARA